jgi:hypothetical protein
MAAAAVVQLQVFMVAIVVAVGVFFLWVSWKSCKTGLRLCVVSSFDRLSKKERLMSQWCCRRFCRMMMMCVQKFFFFFFSS